MEEEYKPIKIENISKQGLKSSQEKAFRKQLEDSLPQLEQIVDQLFTKKAEIQVGKTENFKVYFINNEPCCK